MGQVASRQSNIRSPATAYGRLSILESPHNRARTLKALRQERQEVETGEATRLLKKASTVESVGSVSPPLGVWIGPALTCALCYALYNIFIKKGSASIHPVLGGVILQVVAAMLGAVLLVFILIHSKDDGDSYDKSEYALYWDLTGVQWAILAGMAVGAAEMLSFYVSSLGVQAMQSIPIIIGGSVLFGTLLGFALLGEVLSWQGWSGVVLISLGISLVGTDPASTALAH